MNERGTIILEYFNIHEEKIIKHNDGSNASIHNNKYKICPKCGQGLIPFKYGLCICGNQIGLQKFLVDKVEDMSCFE